MKIEVKFIDANAAVYEVVSGVDRKMLADRLTKQILHVAFPAARLRNDEPTDDVNRAQ